MYHMHEGRAEAGLDDGEDLRHRDAESFGRLVVDDVGEYLGDVGRAGAEEDMDQRRVLVGVEHQRRGQVRHLAWKPAIWCLIGNSALSSGDEMDAGLDPTGAQGYDLDDPAP